MDSHSGTAPDDCFFSSSSSSSSRTTPLDTTSLLKLQRARGLANPESSSEAASLKGHVAKTPIIAGTICGTVMLIAWIVGFIVYMRKRRLRKKRLAREGKTDAEIAEEDFKSTKKKMQRASSGIGAEDANGVNRAAPGANQGDAASRHGRSQGVEGEERREKFIIPPDPAIVLGYRKPGEKAFLDEEEGGKRPSMKKWGSSAKSTGGHAAGLSTSTPPAPNTELDSENRVVDKEKDFAHGGTASSSTLLPNSSNAQPTTHRINEDTPIPGG